MSESKKKAIWRFVFAASLAAEAFYLNRSNMRTAWLYAALMVVAYLVGVATRHYQKRHQ